jgi:hypothetical protein
MGIKVTRYGGPMAAMKPKTKTFEIGELDTSTRQALDELLEQKPTATAKGRMPDGFVYSFEMDDAGATKKEVEVNGTHVPDALRKLLP